MREKGTLEAWTLTNLLQQLSKRQDRRGRSAGEESRHHRVRVDGLLSTL